MTWKIRGTSALGFFMGFMYFFSAPERKNIGNGPEDPEQFRREEAPYFMGVGDGDQMECECEGIHLK